MFLILSRMSGHLGKRRIPHIELVNMVWLGLLSLAIAIYWISNPSLLSDMISMIEKAISGEPNQFSDVLINFALLFIYFSAFRFFILMVIGIFEKRFPMVIGNLTYCFILAFAGYLFNSWIHVKLSAYYIVSMLLFLIGLYKISKGLTNGLFHGNQPRILTGNWGDIIFGIRTLILSSLFTEENFLVFKNFTIFLTGTLELPPADFGFTINIIAFMEICLFVYVLTELPKRLIFTQCKNCGMVFLTAGVPESSWDSEHTSKHRHCPRCGAACF